MQPKIDLPTGNQWRPWGLDTDPLRLGTEDAFTHFTNYTQGWDRLFEWRGANSLHPFPWPTLGLWFFPDWEGGSSLVDTSRKEATGSWKEFVSSLSHPEFSGDGPRDRIWFKQWTSPPLFIWERLGSLFSMLLRNLTLKETLCWHLCLGRTNPLVMASNSPWCVYGETEILVIFFSFHYYPVYFSEILPVREFVNWKTKCSMESLRKN